jgi:hypothetical protein
MAKHQRKFTEIDFKTADRLERIYMDIRQPTDFQLNDTDERYKKLIQQAYPLIVSGRPYFEVIKMIQSLENGLWRNQAVQIFRDAQELYAAFDSVHPKILRGMLRETLLENITKMKELRDDDTVDASARVKAAEAITKAADNIAKYARLDKEDIEQDETPSFADIDFAEEITDTEYDDIQNLLNTENTIHDPPNTQPMR